MRTVFIVTIMKKILNFISVFVLLAVASCDIDDGTNFHFEPLVAVSAEFPESFTVGEIYQVDVTYIRPNGCTYFEGFDFRRTALTERYVTLVGSVFDDQPCTEAAEELTVTFNFEVLYDQTYHFKIWAGTNDEGEAIYLEYEVPIAP